MNELKPSISAVVIARNEEVNIASCLETLLWCDEIILVDMESEDQTVEIARKFTSRIYSHPKVPAFDIAKKYAVDQATGDWILLIDADEMVPVPLAEELRCQSLDEHISIVEIPFRHFILGTCAEYTGWGYTPFIHFNYRDSTHFMEKLNRYTSVEAQHLTDRGEMFSYRHLVIDSLREFYRRYLPGRGYREGVRGLALALMMAFYRALTWIKVWELHTFKDDPVTERYKRMRDEILKEWRK